MIQLTNLLDFAMTTNALIVDVRIRVLFRSTIITISITCVLCMYVQRKTVEEKWLKGDQHASAIPV
jgi:hypothetical protein